MKGLERTLGLHHVVAISLGAMLGSGVFVLPGLAAAKTGPSVWLAYVLAGVCVLPAALAKAEMATAMPTSGGTYVYVDRAFGPLAGTVSGLGLWLSLLLKSSFALVGFGAYLGALGIEQYVPLKPTAIAILAAIVALNVAGVKKVGKVMLWIVAFAIIGLVALGVSCHVIGTPVEQGPFLSDGMGGLLGAAAFVFVSYAGVTKVAAIAEEVRNPGRNLPAGMIISLVIAGVLYATVIIGLVKFVPQAELVSDLRPIHTLAATIGGKWVGLIFAVLGVVTMLSMANAGVLAASRFPFAMAREQLLPSTLSRVSERFGTPTVAILATAVPMGFAIWYLEVASIAKLASLFKILIFAVVNVALIVFREGGSTWYRPTFRSPLYPVMPVFGVLASVTLLVFTGIASVWATVAIIAAGVVLYAAVGRRSADRLGVLEKLSPRKRIVEDAADEEHGHDRAAVAVALMGWERSPEALVEVGAALADGRELEVIRLREVPAQMPVSGADRNAAVVRSLRRRISAMAEERQLDLHFDSVVTHDLVQTAHEVTTRFACEWLVIAWRGRRARYRFLFTSPLGWLVNHLDSNLALFRDAGVRYIRKILVYAEPGPDDALVVSTADHLAELHDATLTFVRYLSPNASDEERRSRESYLEQIGGICTRPYETQIVSGARRVRALVDVTSSFDLMVTGAPSWNSVMEQFRGTDKERIIESAECSVLMLKTPPGSTHAMPIEPLAEGSPAATPFDLMDLLRDTCVGARAQVSDKSALFELLAERLDTATGNDDRRAILAALWERERTQHTGIGEGLAFPHCTLSGLDQTYVGVFTLAQPIDYGRPDGETVDVVFASLGPPGDRQTHLQVLAELSTLVVRTALLDELRGARNGADIRAVIAEDLAAVHRDDPGISAL